MAKPKILRDTSWNILDYLSTIIIFLITTKLLIEKIGIDGYGFYVFFTSLIGAFGLADLGMGMAVSKYLSEFFHHQEQDKANQVITVALLFYTIIGSMLFLLIYIFNEQIIYFLNFGDKYNNIGASILITTFLIFFVNMFSGVMINTLTALEEWKIVSLLNIFIKVINATLLAYILLMENSAEEKILSIFSLLLWSSILKLFAHYFFVKQNFKLISISKPSLEVKVKMVKFLKISSLQYGLSLLGGHLDKFIISKFFGLEALGIYSFAVSAFSYLHGFLVSIFKIFLPKMSKLHGDKDTQSLIATLKINLKYAFVIGVLMSISSIFLWKPFVGIYIDNAFASSTYSYFLLFMILIIIRSVDPVFHYFFNAIAKPLFLLQNVIIVSSITLIGYMIFVPIFKIYGLVVAQMVAATIVNVYFLYIIKKRKDIY
jgi:O-antigen/teichoic acid export membrane protein